MLYNNLDLRGREIFDLTSDIEDSYSILTVRDFGRAWRRRTARIMLNKSVVSEVELENITRQIWVRSGQDVDEMITVFYLPGMDTNSVAYSFGSCMKDGVAKVSYR